MRTHAYLFEAKSIQSFILATNRLKEIVGASELVEWLTGTLPADDGKPGPRVLLDDVLDAIGADAKNLTFSRRGGGAFYVFSADGALIGRLAALWPLVVRQFAPGVEFVQARGEGEGALSAFDDAHRRLRAERNRHVVRLPQAGPLAQRDRRTGDPATAFARNKKDKRQKVPVDGATRRKLDFSRGVRLGRRFHPGMPWHMWPLNLSPEERAIEIDGEEEAGGDVERDFPFVGDARSVAVIHADGNGVGSLLIALQAAAKEAPESFVEGFAAFSRAVGEATRAAAEYATETVLDEHREAEEALAARPIVLGGDDLTILVRADLALPFTRDFLAAFASESEARLTKIRKTIGIRLPRRLTACAGIAYVKSSQPFHLAHDLAEALCKHAKQRAKPQAREGVVPSALAFHRVTTAMVDDYSLILGEELTADDLFRQTLECYTLEPVDGLPLLDHLLALRELLEGAPFSRGPTRELLGLVGSDTDQARRRYRRWREVVSERGRREGDDRLRRFDDALAKLISPPPDHDLPYDAERDGLRRSPLGDLTTLQSIGSR